MSFAPGDGQVCVWTAMHMLSSVLQLDTSDDDDIDHIGASACRHTNRVPTEAASTATTNGLPSAEGTAGKLTISLPSTMSGMMVWTLSLSTHPDACLSACHRYRRASGAGTKARAWKP
jgi:hypothetical protein